MEQWRTYIHAADSLSPLGVESQIARMMNRISMLLLLDFYLVGHDTRSSLPQLGIGFTRQLSRPNP